jgi:hypothetical protein
MHAYNICTVLQAYTDSFRRCDVYKKCYLGMTASCPDDFFHTGNANLGIFWKDLGWNTFCGHLVYVFYPFGLLS